MLQIDENLDGVLDEFVEGLLIEPYDEAGAAAIMLIGGIAKAARRHESGGVAFKIRYMTTHSGNSLVSSFFMAVGRTLGLGEEGINGLNLGFLIPRIITSFHLVLGDEIVAFHLIARMPKNATAKRVELEVGNVT